MRARFGPFTIDSAARRLRRDGVDLHLSPKGFDLLCLLIEERPKVIDKTALQARIWPDTYVVEGNLNVLIGEIRRTLGDNPRQPTFIRTVHGVGYAFAAEATEERAARPERPMPCWLASKDKTYRLSEGENIVGRDPDCAVWLDAPSVSRRHARVVVSSADRRVSVEDLDSTNGTFVSGQPTAGAVPLVNGAEITFGSIEVTLRSWATDQAAETKRISRKSGTRR